MLYFLSPVLSSAEMSKGRGKNRRNNKLKGAYTVFLQNKKGFGGTDCAPKTGLRYHIEPYMSARFVIPLITQRLRWYRSYCSNPSNRKRMFPLTGAYTRPHLGTSVCHLRTGRTKRQLVHPLRHQARESRSGRPDVVRPVHHLGSHWNSPL